MSDKKETTEQVQANPEIVNGINLEFNKELVEAYNNSILLSKLGEQMKSSYASVPIDSKTYTMAPDGKIFDDEKELQLHLDDLATKTATPVGSRDT